MLDFERRDCNDGIPNLQRMREEEKLCDVVFLVDQKRFPAHRVLLAAASPVFEAMFTNGMAETVKKEVVIDEILAKTWEITLNFVYHQSFTLCDKNQGLEVLACAQKFQIDKLEGIATDFLVSELNGENCCELLDVADYHGFVLLKSRAMEVLAHNFSFASQTESFAQLQEQVLKEVVRSAKLRVQSEIDVLNAIIWWLACNGHQVDDELLSGYSARNPNILQGSSKSNTFIGVPPLHIRNLMASIHTKDLSFSDLKHAIILCHKAQLQEMANHLMDLFGDSSSIEFPSPVPRNMQVFHLRSSRRFSFRHRFYNVSKLIAIGASLEAQFSPWFEDAGNHQRWRLEVYFRGYGIEHRGKHVSVYLRKEHISADVTRNGEMKVASCFYVLSANEEKTEWTETDENDALEHYGRNARGYNAFIEVEDFRKVVNKSSDSVSFGVDLHFSH